ncbi:restriction endonuclease subunit S [Bacillus velezensis]|uniref:restriction endonuclease subunit S n=1 Tax=Bacillus velezensis TaxID=492670 RepID=UPI000955E2A5|nr:restriction endonuclease subunit S [Bacillus velezensis]SIS05819.1 type I restriction enzyme, S subunit [Bacillus velezensis]
MENKRTPEIRFPGYSGDWEERKLEEVANYRNGKAHEKDISENGKFIVINSKFVSTNGKTRKYSDKQIEPMKVNEIAFVLSDVPNGRAIARTFLVDENNKYSLNQRIAGITPNSNTDAYFLSTLLNRHHYFLRFDDGVGQTNLSKKDVENFSEKYPSMEEQSKIGKLFRQLDDTITLHQQELTTLKQTKQGFLQKMFPKEGESVPEVRFPGFDGEWEEQKLDSIVNRVKSYSLSRDVETTEYTGYKYIHYGDIHTKVADIIDEFSDLPNIKAGNYELLKKGDLVVADASEDYQGIAAPAVITIDVPYKLVSGLHTIALRPKQIDSLFLYYLINSQTFRKYGYKAGTGMKVFGISATNLLRFESVFPTFEEQTKIGNFFKQLDDIITLHQRELDALKETKKAFLQKMFV